MTLNEQAKIIEALHQMELRQTERMARVEEQIKNWRKTEKNLIDAQVRLQDRISILTIWLVVVTLIALGDGALRVMPLL